jgi:hypothetical protein
MAMLGLPVDGQGAPANPQVGANAYGEYHAEMVGRQPA